MFGDEFEGFGQRHVFDVKCDGTLDVGLDEDGFPGLPLDFFDDLADVHFANIEGDEIVAGDVGEARSADDDGGKNSDREQEHDFPFHARDVSGREIKKGLRGN